MDPDTSRRYAKREAAEKALGAGIYARERANPGDYLPEGARPGEGGGLSPQARALIGAMLASTDDLEAAGVESGDGLPPTDLVFASEATWAEARGAFPLVHDDRAMLGGDEGYHADNVALPPGCTGAMTDGRIEHDGDTCPIHERGE